MLEIRKSHEADSDIESIWHFTISAYPPAIGKARDEIRTDLRAYHVGRHFIYYYIRDDHIYIVRVRHDRSDPTHFEE